MATTQEEPEETMASTARPGDSLQPPETRELEELGVLHVVNAVLRRRMGVASAALAFGVLSAAIVLFGRPTYTVESTFTPQAPQANESRIAGLAAQFGVSLGVGAVGQTSSPQFYSELLRSREILRNTALFDYRVAGDDGGVLGGDLVTIFEIQEDTRAIAEEIAVELLRESLAVSADATTGLVELEVSTPWPQLSTQIADRLIHLVHAFNLETRQSQAAAERRFIENQLERAEEALRTAEGNLEGFLSSNRSYQSSPELTFQFERLQRRVQLRQQLFISLSQAYEEARIQEVRDMPVITVIDPPRLPARPDDPGLFIVVAIGMFLGLALALFGILAGETLGNLRRTDPETYEEFEGLVKETRKSIGRTLFWRR